MATYTGITRRVFWILASSGTAAVAAIILLVVTMAGEADELARDTARRLVGSALNSEVGRVSISTRDYANWDEAHAWIQARDADAVLANLGTGATEGPTFDFMFFTSADGTPIYGYAFGGETSDLSGYDWSGVSETLAAVRTLPVEPYQSIAAFARIGGRTAILGAGRVQPYDADGLKAEDLPVMLAGLWITPELLKRTGAEILVPDLVPLPLGEDLAPDRSAWDLMDIEGHVIGRVGWPSPQPGRKMLARALPIIVATSFLLFAGVFVVGRASARQSASYVRERLKARTDSLTGLMNRSGLSELVGSAQVKDAIRRGEAAVVYLDLDGFKKLNDEAGHDGGDRALVITAERLRRSMRHADTIARLGGDEFAALILDPQPEEAVRAVCDRILMQTELPLRIGKTQYFARPSIGVAVAFEGAHWDDLLIRADAAMYRAKKNRLGQPVFDLTRGVTSRPVSQGNLGAA